MMALVDVNSFYASCEQVFRPDLWGKPVVVLSNNDGCIIAANREAKNLGIPMWKPAFEVLPRLRQHQVSIFSSNYPLYGDMSRRVMETLSTLTPALEIYSIDEAFLSVPGTEPDLEAYAQRLRRRVHQWTGLPVGVGIAPTKTLTKVASRMAKRERERNRNIFVIADEATRTACLKDFPVEDIWGIGKRISKRLHERGIHTAWDFTGLPDVWVRRELTVTGLRLKRELEGTPQLDLEIDPPAKQMIGTAKSFGKNLETESLIREALAWYVAEVAVKLRKQHRIAGRMTVYLETNRFREQDEQYVNQIQLKLPVPTDDTPALCHCARLGFDKIFRPGYRYKKVGVWLSDLVLPGAVQQNLFEPDPQPRRPELMQVMDRVNRKYGKAKLRTASAGFRRNEWKLRQQQLSPRYTTCIDEIMQIP
ncbi:MAG: Y-family DNA polymerase [Kiritimatiellia bacterium]